MVSDSPLDTTIVLTGGSADLSAMQQDMGHYLHVLEGERTGQRIEIGTSPMIFGRDKSADIMVNDVAVSRRHFQCTVFNNDLVATDLGSTNGTFIDGAPLTEMSVVSEGSIIQLGAQVMQYERRSREDVARSQELDRDLEKARSYVMSLLPEALSEGPILTDWFYLPSAKLGGDAFGYYMLDDDHFATYVVDVSGHGVGAAMLSVSILNVMGQRALPDTDFLDPAAVLASLNDMFQMDDHDGQYFTMWYGVYNLRTRTLKYGAAGHHAGYLVPSDRSAADPLLIKALMIGAMPGMSYKSAEVTVPEGASLYLFSDGVFEVLTADEQQWTLDEFLPLLQAPIQPDMRESRRLYRAVRDISRPGPFDDDFSLVVVTFK